jgi:hypothetical protein
MSESAKRIGTYLFWFQIVCAIIFGGSQALKMFESTQGVSMAFFACHGLFALFNLSLSLAALAAADGDRKVKQQSVYIYLMWTGILVVHLVIAGRQMPDKWNLVDSVAMACVSIGVVGVIILAKFQTWPVWAPMDPFVKTGLSIVCKSVPQVTLAVNIYLHGSAGLSGVWILVGHITICTRIVHLIVSNHERWDRNTKGSLISEIWNEASWLVASLAWVWF